MVTTFCLLAIAVLYSIASYSTYSQEVRNSNAIFPINITISVLSTLVWIYLVKSLNDTNKIIAASLAWDVIVTMAYAVVPAILQGKNLPWQSYAALFVIFAALMWFKLSSE